MQVFQSLEEPRLKAFRSAQKNLGRVLSYMRFSLSVKATILVILTFQLYMSFGPEEKTKNSIIGGTILIAAVLGLVLTGQYAQKATDYKTQKNRLRFPRYATFVYVSVVVCYLIYYNQMWDDKGDFHSYFEEMNKILEDQRDPIVVDRPPTGHEVQDQKKLDRFFEKIDQATEELDYEQREQLSYFDQFEPDPYFMDDLEKWVLEEGFVERRNSNVGQLALKKKVGKKKVLEHEFVFPFEFLQ